ncbi:MAG: hypothetical protein ACRC5C_05820, partial [Bacilli bacterium]
AIFVLFLNVVVFVLAPKIIDFVRDELTGWIAESVTVLNRNWDLRIPANEVNGYQVYMRNDPVTCNVISYTVITFANQVDFSKMADWNTTVDEKARADFEEITTQLEDSEDYEKPNVYDGDNLYVKADENTEQMQLYCSEEWNACYALLKKNE